MGKWTRREILKTGIIASAASAFSLKASGQPQVDSATLSEKAVFVQPSPSPRKKELLDFGWRFHLGHATDPALDFGFGASSREGIFAKTYRLAAPSNPNFNDTEWQTIDLPHDWAVELPFVNDKILVDHGAKPLGRSYPATSVGWYRRVFEIPKSDEGKRISLEFDGVYRNALVIFNGHYIGENLSGYAPFRFDITDHANYGAKNVLVVRVDATEYEGWFYEGAGIYRHVWLTTTDPLHLAHYGTFVRSEIQAGVATLIISTELENEYDAEKSCRVLSRVIDAAGRVAGESQSAPTVVSALSKKTIEQRITLRKPALWSLEEPNLYTLATSIDSGGQTVDGYETPFGIRMIRFDPDRGFFLNDKPVKVKGTCNHQDHAGVGAAVPDRIQYFRIERLKSFGCNAYRTSHNPPTPELLDACDRLGMLVMDETRMMSSSPEGLSQLERMVRRDRNHPSVILWSMGNEEPEQGSDRGKRIVASMKNLVKSLDPSRPVTLAMNGRWGMGASAVVDVQGCNYYDKNLDGFHEKFPKQPMIGSETASTVGTRGIYENDKDRGYVSTYDLNAPSWGATAEFWWKIYDERPFLAGGFVWTGFDYRGEPTPYNWPCISSHFGIMDTCGFPKDNYYYYQAWWKGVPTLHIFPHWNWTGKEGKEIDVWCHSNYDEVELFLNGKSFGKQTVQKDTHLAWKVPYSPGALTAKGFRNGKEVETAKVETTGKPVAIKLSPYRPTIDDDGEDVAIVAASIVDSEGRVVPIADNEVNFEVSTNARIIGVGNGDPSSHEPDKATKRKAFNGLLQVIVQGTKQPGQITLTATSPTLQSTQLIIEVKKVEPRAAVS